MLTDDVREFLERLDYHWEEQQVGAETQIVIHDFDVSARFAPRKTNLLFRLLPGYPVTAPVDMFWARPILLLAGTNARPQNTQGTEKHLGVEWQTWSRHLNGWRAGVDTFETFFQSLTMELLQ